MDDVLSPMVEMMPTMSTEFSENDEFIQDFRLSVVNAQPAVALQDSSIPHTPFVGLMRSPDPIRSLALFSPQDGGSPLVITGGDTGQVLIWELKTFKLVRKLEGVHSHKIRGLAVYCPSQQPRSNRPAVVTTNAGEVPLSEKVLLVSGSDDKTAAVWDLLKGTLIVKLVGAHRWFVTSVAIYMPTYGTSPFVVSSGWDNFSVVWNVSTGKPIMKLSCKGSSSVSTVIDFVSPELQQRLGRDPREAAQVPILLTTGFDKTITLWDGESSAVLKQYATVHTDIISCAAVFVPPAGESGLYCLTGSFDNTAILWDLLTGAVIRTLEGHTDWIMSVAIFRTNSCKPFFVMGLTGCHDGSAMLWDLVHGIPVRRFEGVQALPNSGVRFLARFPGQGGSSRSAFDPSVKLCGYYQPRTGPNAAAGETERHTREKTASIDLGNVRIPSAGAGSELGQGRDPNSFPLIFTCSEDHTVVLWDLDSVQTQQLVRHPTAVPLGIQQGGSMAGSGATMKPSANANATSTSLETDRDWVITLEIFAPVDGRRPVLLSGSSSGAATAWDLLSGQVIREFTGVHSLDVSGVGMVETDFPRFVSERKTRAKSRGNHHSSSYSGDSDDLRPCVSAEGKALVVVTCAFDGKIAVWDFDSGELLQELGGVHTDSMSHVAISAPFGVIDYMFVVASSYDNTASIWNLHTGDVVHRLSAPHTDAVTHVAIYKPESRTATVTAAAVTAAASGEKVRPLVLTGGVDCIVVIWDALTGVALRTLLGGHVERIKTVITYQPLHGDPIVVTGGYDKRAVVWDLHTGALKMTLAGVHKNWVTSVAVVEPNDGGRVFIVTGGFDGMPIVWDLETGEFICKLEGGHQNGIRALVAYTGVPKDHGRYAPLVISAGHDSYIVKWDCQYPFRSMPPRSTVQIMFELDRSEALDKMWPRISALSVKFGESLWAENSQMFIRACQLRRSDFLSRFQHMLAMMLGRLGDVEPDKSLLRYALEKKDLQTVRVVLRCWAQILNKPLCDARLLRYHPSLLLPLHEVLLLGSVYPAEFTVFICSLRLIHVGSVVSMSAVIDPASKGVIQGSSVEDALEPFKLFDAVPYGQESRGQPVSMTYMPLMGAASVEMLHMLMQTSLALDSVAVFDSDVVVYALRFAWKHYGLQVHAVGVMVFLLFFAIYTPNILLFESLAKSDNAAERGMAWFLQSITFAFMLVRTLFAFLKMRYANSKGALQQYFEDGWNILDMSSIALSIIGLFARFTAQGESHFSRSFLAVATILLWMRGLYYLRPFRLSGPLVSMVIAIAYDIKVFLLIMAVALIGFSQGFWLLSRRGEGLPFGSASQALLSSFDYMMGNFDVQFDGSISPTLSTFLVLLFVIFMIVLMLNLLIALMGNTFAYVSGKGLAQWRQEQTSIVLDEQFMRDDKLVVPPCLFVLMYTTDYEEYVEQREKLDAEGVAAVKQQQQLQGAGQAPPEGSRDGEGAKAVTEGLAILEKKVMERVERLEYKLESLISKLDKIADRIL